MFLPLRLAGIPLFFSPVMKVSLHTLMSASFVGIKRGIVPNLGILMSKISGVLCLFQVPSPTSKARFLRDPFDPFLFFFRRMLCWD